MIRKIVAAMLTAALVLALAGCGGGEELSLSEYRKSISELHDGVAWDLGVVFEGLNDLNFKDFYDLPALADIFSNAHDIFDAAWINADAMYPPPEAIPLHLDLLDFYSEGVEGAGELVNAMGFFEAVLPMLKDVQNLALPDLPEEAGVPEIKAAAMEDRKTMDVYLKDLEGMEPPDDLQPYHEKLKEFFRSIDEAVSAMDQAVTPEDRNPYMQFRQWFGTTLEESRALWDEAMAYLGALNARVDGYIEEGKELAGRIQQL
jgi:hypothetical protein